MTSTPAGLAGISCGWLNYELIASGKFQPHINAFGGEDRFWLGPEGGQFSIFFKNSDPFELEHWQTPAVIDSIPYVVSEQAVRRVVFRHTASLTNYWGRPFTFEIQRALSLLDAAENAAASWDKAGGQNQVGRLRQRQSADQPRRGCVG
jgi:hypothetical protein